MKRIIILSIFILWLTNTASHAEILRMYDGSVIQGEIIENTGYYIKINVDGNIRRINTNEILSMETDEEFFGEPLSGNIKSISGLTKEHVQLIKKYMDVIQAKETMQAELDKSIENATENEKALMLKVFNIDQIIIDLIPIYAQYYDEETLRVLVGFYESPARKKELESTPLIMQDMLKNIVQSVQTQL